MNQSCGACLRNDAQRRGDRFGTSIVECFRTLHRNSWSEIIRGIDSVCNSCRRELLPRLAYAVIRKNGIDRWRQSPIFIEDNATVTVLLLKYSSTVRCADRELRIHDGVLQYIVQTRKFVPLPAVEVRRRMPGLMTAGTL